MMRFSLLLRTAPPIGSILAVFSASATGRDAPNRLAAQPGGARLCCPQEGVARARESRRKQVDAKRQAALQARSNRKTGRPSDPGLSHDPKALNSSHRPYAPGGVAERFKAPVLKTGVRETVPWVRIPPPPPLAPAKAFYRSDCDHETQNNAQRRGVTPVGLPAQFVTPPPSLILIDAESHIDCRRAPGNLRRWPLKHCRERRWYRNRPAGSVCNQ